MRRRTKLSRQIPDKPQTDCEQTANGLMHTGIKRFERIKCERQTRQNFERKITPIRNKSSVSVKSIEYTIRICGCRHAKIIIRKIGSSICKSARNICEKGDIYALSESKFK